MLRLTATAKKFCSTWARYQTRPSTTLLWACENICMLAQKQTVVTLKS